MKKVNSNPTSEREIREIVKKAVTAIRAKDINSLLTSYATGIVSFDVVNALQYKGVAEIKERMEEWFTSFDGPIGYKLHELDVSAGDDVAFCHSLNQVSATKKDGGKLEMWWRATVCYRKISGKWLITHQHSSVPFSPETGNASLDLKP